jgi:hypothetical protein
MEKDTHEYVRMPDAREHVELILKQMADCTVIGLFLTRFADHPDRDELRRLLEL